MASRHWRDSATAAKALVLVSIDQLQRVDDPDGAIARQQVNRVEAFLALHVDEVFEVPTHELKARLFARLRAHFQRRDRLRLVIGYRRKDLESLVRQGEEEAGKIAQEYRQASAQSDREYAETAASVVGRLCQTPPVPASHRDALQVMPESWR